MMYKEGDVVGFFIDRKYYESKVFNVSNNGDSVFVDFLEGDIAIHRRDREILSANVELIAKAKTPEFTINEIRSLLINIKCN